MNIEGELITTVVGSFPEQPSKEEMSKSYFHDSDPYEESVRKAVEAQLGAGIDLVSDGQVRGNMIEIFSKGLRGFRKKEKVEIVSDIQFIGPITVQDARKVKKMLPEAVGVKGIITGPWTMVKNTDNLHYRDEKEAVLDTAEALHKEAEHLAKVCDVVQVDEPFFSVEYPQYGKEAVETVLDVKCPTALHVCGDVAPIAEELITMDVSVLDHEFAANPSLFDTYENLTFDQRLAVGVVKVDSSVESVSEIKERIERAYEVFGPKTMIDPDCGLRNLERETAVQKLKNMVKARNEVLEEIR